MLLVVTCLLAALTRASSALQQPSMLSYVPGYEAADQLSADGRYDMEIDHHDVFGGHTLLSSKIKFNQERFVDVSQKAFVSCNADTIVLRAALAPAQVAFGSLLSGKGVASCCSVRDTAVTELGDALHMSFCAKQVTAVTHTDDVVVYQVTELNPLSIIESLHVKFMHSAGNRTREEAMAAAQRKREPWVEADFSERIEAFNFNYDRTADKASKQIAIYTPASLVGFKSKCIECYAALSFNVDFEVIIDNEKWYKFPTVQFVKLVFSGQLDIANVIETEVPVTTHLLTYTKDLKPHWQGRAIYIPAGLLAFTVEPALIPQFIAGFAISSPITLRRGSKNKVNVGLGFQWKAKVGPKKIWWFRTKTAYPKSFDVPTVDQLAGEINVGLGLSLEALVGVSLSAAAASGHGGLQFLEGAVALEAQNVFSFKRNTAKKCTEFSSKFEVPFKTEISAIIMKVGGWETKVGVGGGLPQLFGFKAYEKVCESCTRCLDRKRSLGDDGPIEWDTEEADESEELVGQPDSTTASADEGSGIVRHEELNVHFSEEGQEILLLLERILVTVDWEVTDEILAMGGTLEIGVERTYVDGHKENYIPYVPPFDASVGQYTFELPVLFEDIRGDDQARLVLFSSKNQGIFARSPYYDVSKGNSLKKRQFEYTGVWPTYTTWSACDHPCGEATRTRRHYCLDMSSEPVEDEVCESKHKMQFGPDQEACDLPPCQFVPFSFKQVLVNDNAEEFGPSYGSVVVAKSTGDLALTVSIGGGFYNKGTNVELCVGCGRTETCLPLGIVFNFPDDPWGAFVARTYRLNVDDLGAAGRDSITTARFKALVHSTNFFSYSPSFYIVREGREASLADADPMCEHVAEGASDSAGGQFRNSEQLLAADATQLTSNVLLLLASALLLCSL